MPNFGFMEEKKNPCGGLGEGPHLGFQATFSSAPTALFLFHFFLIDVFSGSGPDGETSRIHGDQSRLFSQCIQSSRHYMTHTNSVVSTFSGTIRVHV